jgi:hypothetical protein
MKTKNIYEKFNTPKGLQEHMLRVAAIGEIIMDNWIGSEIDKDAILFSLLFHDIAKPVTFEITKQKKYAANTNEYQQIIDAIQSLREKYGSDEHGAVEQIFKEIGASEEALNILNNLEWSYLPRLIDENEIKYLLAIYCDMRVGPKGILPIKTRLEDLSVRAPFEGLEELIEHSLELEKIMQDNTTVRLDLINDMQIDLRLEKLLLHEN